MKNSENNENKKIKIEITDMTSDGSGFGRFDNMAVFVDGALPGDTVLAEIIKQKKNFADARLSEIVEESDARVDSPCPHSSKCGGCSLLCYDYDAQLVLKRRQVYDKIERLGGITSPVVRDTIGMEEPYHYRNKGEYPAAYSNGKSYVGFYEKKSHRIVDAKECMLQSAVANICAKVLREYNEGEVKQMIVKTAFGTGEVMMILECDPVKTTYLEALIHASEDAIYDSLEEYSLESVYALNDGKYKLIAGKKTIIDTVSFGEKELSFEISAPSFYQVNTKQMKKLYAKALEYAGLDGSQTVLDLYCGIGTIGLSMAAKASKIVGVEIVKEAVLDANRNAVINRIVNARYICGKAEEVLPACANPDNEFDELSGEYCLQQALAEDNVVAVLDPPRAGCDAALLKCIADAGVKKIVYISCDPASLSRDIKLLCDMGYSFEEASPVDMFPHTMHIETVALLSK